MNLKKELEKLKKKTKLYNYLLGKKKTVFWLYDFMNPLKKKQYRDTLYFFFKAKIIEIDGKKIESNNHTIQLPGSTIMLALYDLFEEKNILDEEKILLEINRKDNYNYNITILR